MAAMTDAPRIRRGGKPKALSAQVARLTRRAFARRGLADGQVLRDWPAIVGESLAEWTLPERLATPRDGGPGVLHLRVAGGALALEIQHLEPQIVERINGFFGFRAVERLRLVHGPLPDRPPAPAPAEPPPPDSHVADLVAGVADPDLKAALDRLGRSVAARRRRESEKDGLAET